MPVAEISLSIPDEIWLADVTDGNPDASFRVISIQTGSDTGTALLEVKSENPVPIISTISEKEDVRNLELLWKRGNEALLQIDTEARVLLDPISQVGVPVKTPFSVAEGEVSWEIATSQAKLSELADQLDSIGVAYEVSTVRGLQEHRMESLLTDRQQEVLITAFDSGYYDTPRGITLTQVADTVGVTKATCSDILHRAEGKIVEAFIAENVSSVS